MREIICPYCCERFLPSAVDFRLERPLDNGDSDNADTSADTGSSGRFANRRAGLSGGASRVAGMVRDDKLYRYYKEKLQMSDQDAASNASQLPVVEMDLMSPDIEYNVEDYNMYGYVTKIRYKGQVLTRRLCPECHNPIIPNAGKYDMLMFSLIGDTNVGKTVYLTVLEQALKGGKFRGNLSFMGTDEEKEMYLSNLTKLLTKRETLNATQRTKIPPMPFLYTYTTPDTTEKQYKLIVFCDIAGEDCRDERTMKQNGYHLKASDGFLFLIDVTRFPNVAHGIEDGSSLSHMYQSEIFSAINRYLIADTYENTTRIPAAVVLSKSDVLEKVGRVYGNTDYRDILTDTRPDIHPGYYDIKESYHLNSVVPAMVEELGDDVLVSNVQDNFSSYAYFVASALGKSPELIVKEEDGMRTEESRVRGLIMPYRIAEPFYWLLAKCSCIPYYYYEVLEHPKNGTKRIEFYYYENEKDSLQARIESARRSMGINLSGFMNRWKVIESAQV